MGKSLLIGTALMAFGGFAMLEAGRISNTGAAAGVEWYPKNIKHQVIRDATDGTKNSVTVRFTNRDAGEVRLEVEPTCGCTSVKLADSTLQPNQSTDLLLQLDPNSIPKGRYRKDVSIRIHRNGQLVRAALPLLLTSD
jgi:hypothetical protein